MCPAPVEPFPLPDAREASRVLVDRARRLRLSIGERGAAPLKGRHVAIAAERHDAPSARLFERAALSLGARVSHIGPEALEVVPQRQDVAARILGSLYDAIDVIPLPSDRAATLQLAAGVPVFADLGGADSPLLELLTIHEDPQEREAELLSLMQAVLLQAVR